LPVAPAGLLLRAGGDGLVSFSSPRALNATNCAWRDPGLLSGQSTRVFGRCVFRGQSSRTRFAIEAVAGECEEWMNRKCTNTATIAPELELSTCLFFPVAINRKQWHAALYPAK